MERRGFRGFLCIGLLAAGLAAAAGGVARRKRRKAGGWRAITTPTPC